jgi:hypothetical protein
MPLGPSQWEQRNAGFDATYPREMEKLVGKPLAEYLAPTGIFVKDTLTMPVDAIDGLHCYLIDWSVKTQQDHYRDVEARVPREQWSTPTADAARNAFVAGTASGVPPVDVLSIYSIPQMAHRGIYDFKATQTSLTNAGLELLPFPTCRMPEMVPYEPLYSTATESLRSYAYATDPENAKRGERFSPLVNAILMEGATFGLGHGLSFAAIPLKSGATWSRGGSTSIARRIASEAAEMGAARNTFRTFSTGRRLTGDASLDLLARDSGQLAGFLQKIQRAGFKVTTSRFGDDTVAQFSRGEFRYDPGEFRVFHLMHENRHFSQIQSATRAGLNPFEFDRSLGAMLEWDAYNYELWIARRYNLSEEYIARTHQMRDSYRWPVHRQLMQDEVFVRKVIATFGYNPFGG